LAAGVLLLALALSCAPSLAAHAAGADNSAHSAGSPGPSGLEEDGYVEVEKTRLHFVEGGAGSQAVVLLHGNAGSVEDFEYGVSETLSRDYRVVAFDRPGHGRSARPGGKAASVEYQALMLHETLQRLGVNSPILVGHSWGASLALCYALKYPAETAGLVLLAPAAYPDSDPNPLMKAVIKTPLVGNLALTFGKALVGAEQLRRDLEKAFYPQSVPENYLKAATSTWLGRKQLRAYLEDEWSLNESLRGMSKRYGELRLPVVIVTGDSDQVVSPQGNAYRLREAIPRARLVELEGTGHEIPLTRPESVYGALRQISGAASDVAAAPPVLSCGKR
jgi:pimeloyl-ACP methyl ester carboxylesterase